MGLLSEESKEHEMIMERDGKYLPVIDEPRRPLKPRVPSNGESRVVLVIFLFLVAPLARCEMRLK